MHHKAGIRSRSIGNNPIKNPPICAEPSGIRKIEKTEKEREGARERRREKRESTAVLIHFLHAHSVTTACIFRQSRRRC